MSNMKSDDVGVFCTATNGSRSYTGVLSGPSHTFYCIDNVPYVPAPTVINMATNSPKVSLLGMILCIMALLGNALAENALLSSTSDDLLANLKSNEYGIWCSTTNGTRSYTGILENPSEVWECLNGTPYVPATPIGNKASSVPKSGVLAMLCIMCTIVYAFVDSL